ncbi:helix-turn-helix transcriptional regulator [Bacillus sp. APMAM]|nr:helix-turn-helix transcriptional regulator [Bacillus sp. APMAM]RTZ54421.1 XRE family transcriptional regulator [Bacillus sp. SAJ1]
MLGERIRKLRKQKKMTLEALAGEELTKGMLSLIENNKAKPSMESLAYIAKQLEVDVADLLEEISSQELREILEKAENLFNANLKENPIKYEQVITLIEPIIDKLMHGYESARLLDIYSRCLYYEKKNDWQDYLERAAIIYDQINLTSNRASIGIFRSMVKFTDHDYSFALNLLLEERSHIEANHAYIDPITRVNLDYHESILHFAVGDNQSAEKVMENAIHFSKENRIFYLTDDLYRLAAANALMFKNEEKKSYYLQKIKQYGEFAEDIQSILFYKLFDVMSLNEDKKDYSKALKEIDEFFSEPDTSNIFIHWFHLEKGKALYGLGLFEEAISSLEKVEIPSFACHPFDLSLFYVMDSYKALCHLKLGHTSNALHFANIAVENFAPLPQTPFKDFSQETYDMIKHKM